MLEEADLAFVLKGNPAATTATPSTTPTTTPSASPSPTPTQITTVPGDGDCNSVVDFRDVRATAIAIFDPEVQVRCNADCNRDGKVSAADVNEATVLNDNTVRLAGIVIDVPPGPRQRSYAGGRVEVRQLLDGSWRIYRHDTVIATATASSSGELRTLRRRRHRPPSAA